MGTSTQSGALLRQDLVRNRILSPLETMDNIDLNAAAAPALKTIPSDKDIVKEVFEDAAYQILTAVDSHRAHLPNARSYGSVVNSLFDPTVINSFHGRFARFSSEKNDWRNIKARAEAIIKAFHN